MQIARREELEFLDKLAGWKEVLGAKWIDIDKGDGDRVEIRSWLVARGILRDDSW